MFGRYLSSHSGVTCGMPSAAQRAKSNLPSASDAALDAGGEVLGQREHVVGAEDDARPLGIERLAVAQAGVGQRPLGGGHAHLRFAAHDLEALANRLFLFALQRAEVVDRRR